MPLEAIASTLALYWEGMVDVESDSLNHLFRDLAQWTDILKDVDEADLRQPPAPKGPSPT
jgi:hypothetical protein